MTCRKRIAASLAATTTGLLLSGCSGLFRESLVDGLYTFVSGGISDTLTSGAAQSALQNVLSSLLFPGAATATGIN